MQSVKIYLDAIVSMAVQNNSALNTVNDALNCEEILIQLDICHLEPGF